VWAQEVRHERNFDAEQERTRKLAFECVHAAEAEVERLRASAPPQAAPCSNTVKLLEEIESIAGYPINRTSLQIKAQRFDSIRRKAKAALVALSRPDRGGK
jgi:hypothetical protein